MAYGVHTPVFEGPFDLLLHLILRDEVDLYRVRLSAIVDAYIAHLAELEHLELEVATEFLLIAATLVELKVRRLLPDEDDGDLDDELGLWEQRDLLLARLLECKTFKDVAAVLAHRMDAAARSVARTAGPEEQFLALQPNLLADITPNVLRDAFLAALAPKPIPTVRLDHVTPIRVSVFDTITLVAERVRRLGRLSFRQLCGPACERIDVVVHFLAVLELFKRGHIELDQAENFADLVVVWTGDDQIPSAELVSVDAYDG